MSASPARRPGRPRTRGAAAAGGGMKSLTSALATLEAVVAADGPASLTAIAVRAGVTSSTAHRHLAALTGAELVRQHAATGFYDLGPAALRLGLAALGRLDAVTLATEVMTGLAQSAGATVLLSVWGDNGPVVVRWERGPLPFVTSLGLGSRLPVTRSATGLCFLAFMPLALALPHLQDEASDASAVRAALDDIHERGWTAVDSSVIPGLRALAAPIRDHQGHVACVLTLVGGADLDIGPDGRPVRALLAVATAVSHEVGQGSGE